MVWNISSASTLELTGMNLSLGTVTMAVPQFSSSLTTGIGVTALGINAPSGLLALSIGGWMKITLSNGSTGYLPVWL